MDHQELAELETEIAAARSELESSRSELLDLEFFLAEARFGGHLEWIAQLTARRDEIKRSLEVLRSALARDEECYRKAIAN